VKPLAILAAIAALDGSRPLADLSRDLREVELDPAACYRVRDLQFSKDAARFFLTEGLLIFLKPVDGRRLGAVFSSEVEGGAAEILLIPPTRAERQSLASFTKSPNLAERVRNAVFVFTDGTAEETLAKIRANEFSKPAPEEGFLLASRWTTVIRNLAGSFEVRLAEDLLSRRDPGAGMFFAAVAGDTLGNFDVYHDPSLRQTVTVGQFATRDERRYFDIWTHFPARQRSGAPGREPSTKRIRIRSRIDSRLHLDAETEVDLDLPEPARAVRFEISPRMKIAAAEIDGAPAEIFRRDALRSNLLRNDENESFLAIAAQTLAAGPHTVRIRHEGDVVANAGNRVYFVGARGNWYPSRGLHFVPYELTFRYPKSLGLVASGERVEERTEGEERISRHVSSAPMRFAGFNLGDYERASVSRHGVTVEVFANRRLEAALEPRAAPQLAPLPGIPNARRRLDALTLPPPPPPSPTARLERMAADIASDLEWMSQRLGPPPLKSLAVSPIPGNFGQGFPGLLYLSTLAYLDASTRMGASREMTLYYGELLQAHETAHQWWGNVVASPGYGDDWLQEAMASYLSLMAVERRHGTKAIDNLLGEYRARLLQKDAEGRELESAGPVTFGARLDSSIGGRAWRTIVYEKGAWIVHMLRRRMGDAAFWALMKDAIDKYRFRALSTDEFRELARQAIARDARPDSYRAADPKLEGFFDTWVQGTGVPALKLAWTAKGKAPKVAVTATVTQSGVPDDFSDFVPVEIQPARGPAVRRWVRTSSEPAQFTVTLAAPPSKVTLDPQNAVLKR
jgi:hypothetical protein